MTIDITKIITKEQKTAAAIAGAWERIQAERDRRTLGGFKVNVAGVQKWFHSDPASRTQQLGLFVAGAGVLAVQWKTMDGSFVEMTPDIARAIFSQAFILDTTLFSVAENHRAMMEISPDPAGYDYSRGWPERFVDAV